MPLDGEAWPFATLERGRYGCIAADPPWHFKVWSPKGEDRSPDYDVMTLDKIKALPVADLAAPDCVLLLWATNPMLPQALDVMKGWGFAYKTVGFTWAKTTLRSEPGNVRYHIGLGYWSRANTEMCLLGVRGKPKRVERNVRQLIVSPRREHSRKPTEFYSSAERLVNGPYAELFSRETRPNWDSWGREAGKFDEVAA